MPAPYYQLTKETVDAEIALMREQTKKDTASKEAAIASLIRAGIFTKSGKPKKKFYGDSRR
jgi:hypothetical protein